VTRRSNREIHFAIAANDRGDWELSAECDDELTSFTFLNPAALFGDAEPAVALASVREMLTTEHLSRCTACQRAVA
jgi:hypothetical protein